MSGDTIATILLRNPQLRQISAQLELLAQAQSCLERTLPAELARHCRATAILDNRLILHADSPAWAARLRYLGPDILGALRSEPALSSIRSLRIRTVPHTAPPVRGRPKRSITPRTSQLLRDVAGSIQDPGLRASLLRLSRR